MDWTNSFIAEKFRRTNGAIVRRLERLGRVQPGELQR